MLLSLIKRKTPSAPITSPLLGESFVDIWSPLTKDQYCVKRFSILKLACCEPAFSQLGNGTLVAPGFNSWSSKSQAIFPFSTEVTFLPCSRTKCTWSRFSIKMIFSVIGFPKTPIRRGRYVFKMEIPILIRCFYTDTSSICIGSKYICADHTHILAYTYVWMYRLFQVVRVMYT